MNLSNFDCDDNQFEFNFESLKEDQIVIDKTLNFLVNFNPTKRGRGRPPNKKINKDLSTFDASASSNVNDIPDTVSENLKTITIKNDLYAGILLDNLKKVHCLNKKLFAGFERLTKTSTDYYYHY